MTWRHRTALAAAAALLASAMGATAANGQQAAEPPDRPDRGALQAFIDDLGPVPVAENPPPLPAPAPSAPDGTSTMALPAELCYGINYGDLDEPGDGLLDAWSYGLGFDCVTSTWVLSVDTMDPWGDSDLGWLDLVVDTNNNLSDGCGGAEYAVVIGHDGIGMSGGMIRTPSCDSNTWSDVPNNQLAYFRTAGNHIGLTFNGATFAPVATLRWASSITHWDAYDPIDYLPDTGVRTSPGNPCGRRCFYLTNGTTGGAAEIAFKDDQPATQILIGDWNGDGVDSFGFRVSNTYALKNALAPTAPDITVPYGRATDVVLVGDWDGNGTDTLAVRRGNTYYMKNSFAGGVADITVPYGRPTDVVLVGDWDGNGTDTLAVRRGNTYYISNSFAGGAADITVPYGRATDVVLVGDWDGDGRDSLGVRRDSMYFLKNTIAGGTADVTFAYGRASDITFVGDWNADGRDTLGVRR